MTSPQSACVWIRHALLRTRTKDERSAREKKSTERARGGGAVVYRWRCRSETTSVDLCVPACRQYMCRAKAAPQVDGSVTVCSLLSVVHITWLN